MFKCSNKPANFAQIIKGLKRNFKSSQKPLNLCLSSSQLIPMKEKNSPANKTRCTFNSFTTVPILCNNTTNLDFIQDHKWDTINNWLLNLINNNLTNNNKSIGRRTMDFTIKRTTTTTTNQDKITTTTITTYKTIKGIDLILNLSQQQP